MLDSVDEWEAGPAEASSVSVPAEGLGRPSQRVLCPSAQVRRLTVARSAQPAPSLTRTRKRPCLIMASKDSLNNIKSVFEDEWKNLASLRIFFF